MIDLHTHLIPDVDDGSSCFEESLNMLSLAVKDGITSMVCTPHVFNNFSKYKEVDKIYERFLLFSKQVKQQAISIKLYFGAEIFFISNLLETIQALRGLLTINHSDYFLLEFPMDFVFPGSKALFCDIMSHGLIPIVCHPERNEMFQENIGLLVDLVEAGALTQINAGSITGQFGPVAQSIAHKLIKHNLVHVIASDCHDFHSRPPQISGALAKLGKDEGDKIQLMVNDIPAAIINNRAIPEIGPIIPMNKTASIFSLFKRKKQ